MRKSETNPVDYKVYKLNVLELIELSRGLKRMLNPWEAQRITLLCMQHGISLNLIPNAKQNFSKWIFALVGSVSLGIVLTASINRPEHLKDIVVATIIAGTAKAGYDSGKAREELDTEIRAMIESFNIPKMTRTDN